MSRWHRTEFDLLPEQAFRPRAGGGMTLEGGGGGGGASPAQNYAALSQAVLSREQLDWAKQIYAEQAPDRAQATQLANDVSQAQLDQMRQQTQIAAANRQDYESIYRPIEQQLAADAVAYDTPERRAAESARAVASVETNLAGQRQATMREMERAGVDPSSGKIAALQGSMDLSAAKLKAGAGNAASQRVETVGRAMRSDAANLGRGIASSQATNAALASSLGSAAVGSSNAGLAAQNSGNAMVQQAYNTGISGMGGAASSFGAAAGADAAASARKDNSTAAGLGAALSIAAFFM